MWDGDCRGAAGSAPWTAAYDELAADGMDACGLVRLANRTVGARFVSVIASTLVVAEVLQVLNIGPMFEVIDMPLLGPMHRAAVPATGRSNKWTRLHDLIQHAWGHRRSASVPQKPPSFLY
jgi:hypothetical protein